MFFPCPVQKLRTALETPSPPHHAVRAISSPLRLSVVLGESLEVGGDGKGGERTTQGRG